MGIQICNAREMTASSDPLTEARRLCDQARAAWQAADFESAIEFAREAFSIVSDDPEIVSFCVWLYDVTGANRDAVKLFDALAAKGALSAPHHFHLSLILCRKLQYELATDHALSALQHDPDNSAYARHCASLLAITNRHIEAGRIFVKLLRKDGDDPDIFYQLSFVSTAMNNKQHALLFGQKAVETAPEKIDFAVHYASLLISEQRFDEAVRVLEATPEEFSASRSVCLALCCALNSMQQYGRSLAVVNRALDVLPDDVDLLMNRAAILCALRRFEEAGFDFQNVLRQEPELKDAQRGYYSALCESGQYADAVRIGAGLLKEIPDDAEIGRSLRTILQYRFNNFDDNFDVVSFLARKRERAQALPRRPVENLWLTQTRVLYALLLRDMTTRFGRSKLGYFWVIFEPLAHLGLMVALIGAMGHGVPPIGDSFALFYFTGVICYHMVTHTASSTMNAVRANIHVLQVPKVTIVDVFVSRALLEGITEIAVASLILLGLGIAGMRIMPVNIFDVLAAWGMLWAAGFGLGLINACISSFFHSWEKIWGAMMAIMYFASGTFYVPAMMPGWLRDILAWNPILQGIEMVRRGYFHDHDPPWLDVRYLAIVSLCLLTAGFVGEAVFRRKLTEL